MTSSTCNDKSDVEMITLSQWDSTNKVRCSKCCGAEVTPLWQREAPTSRFVSMLSTGVTPLWQGDGAGALLLDLVTTLWHRGGLNKALRSYTWC